jgi:hypothetical protein
MHRFSIGKQDNSQIPSTHFPDWRPSANSTVLLNYLFHRIFDYPLNPLIRHHRSICTQAHDQEVSGKLHCQEFASRPVLLQSHDTPGWVHRLPNVALSSSVRSFSQTRFAMKNLRIELIDSSVGLQEFVQNFEFLSERVILATHIGTRERPASKSFKSIRHL